MTKEQKKIKQKKIIWDLSYTEALFGIHPENLTVPVFEGVEKADNKEEEAFLKKYEKRSIDLKNLDKESEMFYYGDLKIEDLQCLGFEEIMRTKGGIPVLMRKPVQVSKSTEKVGFYSTDELKALPTVLGSILDYGHKHILQGSKFVLITGNLDSRNFVLTALVHKSELSKVCFELDIKRLLSLEERSAHVIA